ncbi:hypothetical protein MDOR_34440 [Mycolicibacterium doricum]|nr:hypothetical protein MDOR_34440 [Mycolicibacterium doricum]
MGRWDGFGRRDRHPPDVHPAPALQRASAAGHRFRHTAQFNRWRPDRDPRSGTYAQLEQPVTFSLGDIAPGLGA